MINKIKEIANAKGNDKIKVMQKYPELKTVLRYAYDPHKKYYITAPPLEGNTNGWCLNKSSFDILNDLSSRELSGQSALEVVSDHIVSLDKNYAEVFKMILNKDLRCGINVKSINKAYPMLIDTKKPELMLLKTFKKEKCKFPCLAAVKKDGVRARYVDGKLITRAGHELIGMDHILSELEKYDGIEFDGELCVPGVNFDIASGLIRSNNPTPDAIYWVFDMPSNPDNKRKRYLSLTSLIEGSYYVKIIHHMTIGSLSILKKFYNWAINENQKEEGIVIYDPDSLYEDKRSYDWMRMVPLKTADCKVIGFYEGKGKHKNSLGGIIVDYGGHEVKVGTGFKEKIDNDADHNMNDVSANTNIISKKAILQQTRQYIWDNQELFLDAVAECEFKEETKAGSMRQPRFKRWRWDK